jgi:hypothetical protein
MKPRTVLCRHRSLFTASTYFSSNSRLNKLLYTFTHGRY